LPVTWQVISYLLPEALCYWLTATIMATATHAVVLAVVVKGAEVK
jgi:hypothetical protein